MPIFDINSLLYNFIRILKCLPLENDWIKLNAGIASKNNKESFLTTSKSMQKISKQKHLLKRIPLFYNYLRKTCFQWTFAFKILLFLKYYKNFKGFWRKITFWDCKFFLDKHSYCLEQEDQEKCNRVRLLRPNSLNQMMANKASYSQWNLFSAHSVLLLVLLRPRN